MVIGKKAITYFQSHKNHASESYTYTDITANHLLSFYLKNMLISLNRKS